MSQTLREDLLGQILADPDDLSLRKKWARAWEPDDPDFSTFLRLDLDLARATRGVPPPLDFSSYDAERHGLRLERDRLLRSGVRERLLGPRPHPLLDPIVQDGFIAGGRVSAENLLRAPEGVFGRYPVRHLVVSDPKPHMERLARLPWLAQIRTLALRRCRLEDADLTALLGSEHLSGLKMIDLRDNALTKSAAVALARTPRLPNLQVVLIGGNPCPTLEVDLWVDQGYVIGETESSLAIELRSRFGARAWLEPAHTLLTDPTYF